MPDILPPLGDPYCRLVVDTRPAIPCLPGAFVGDYCTTLISGPAESSSAYPRSISPAVGGRGAHPHDGASKAQRHAGKRMVAVEHHLVAGNVGDRVDEQLVL